MYLLMFSEFQCISGFRSSGYRVQVSGYRVQGLGYRLQDILLRFSTPVPNPQPPVPYAISTSAGAMIFVSFVPESTGISSFFTFQPR